MMRVTVFVNTSDDNFRGFRDTHHLATDEDLVLHFDTGDDVLSAAAATFHVGNRMGWDAFGNCWPSDVRSVSVGDVIHVQGHGKDVWMAVERIGWSNITEPRNFVPLTGQANVTSR